MLNFIYWPVSAVLWFWHKAFGFLFGADTGFAWAFAVVFLVFTIRAILIKPFIGQIRSMRKMQEFQPQIKKLQEKYKGDKQKLGEEMQKLQREHGVNPVGGCLPMLIQIPVFVGLFHVLRGFQPNFPDNYVFDHGDIMSFLDATVFGVRLSESIAGGNQALGHYDISAMALDPRVIPVALPLMLIAAVSTHFSARISQQNQSAAAAANPQTAMMGKITMWLFPAGILVFGGVAPLAILLYMLSQNVWTMAQQHLVFKKIQREELEKREQAREQRDQLAPKPGQKPSRETRSVGAPALAASTGVEAADDVPATRGDGNGHEPRDAVPADAGPADGGASAPAPGDAPRRHPGKVARSDGSAGRPGGGSGNSSPGKVGAGKNRPANRPGGSGKKAKKRR